MKQKYEANINQARKGIEELLKLKLNELDNNLTDRASEGEIQACVDAYQKASELAKILGVSTQKYDDDFLGYEGELSRVWGVRIK